MSPSRIQVYRKEVELFSGRFVFSRYSILKAFAGFFWGLTSSQISKIFFQDVSLGGRKSREGEREGEGFLHFRMRN